MKLYLLMLVVVLVIFSGCTQTGEIIKKPASNLTEDLEQNETNFTYENMTGQETGPEEPEQISEQEPADPCAGVECGETITTCPDGFIATCPNICEPDTGNCVSCKPSCMGHEKEECDLECGVCEVLDEEECRCDLILFCDGNGICESGEYPESEDCLDCNDGDPCTQDAYDYDLGSCVYESIIPCCGNLECENGEDELNCPEDCLEEQSGDVHITYIDYDSPEEWIELEGYNVIMTNWTLSDWKEKHVYVFPIFMINGRVKLHWGYGDDNETDLFWQSKSYVWNNDGDNATLRDENGETVDFYNYP